MSIITDFTGWFKRSRTLSKSGWSPFYLVGKGVSTADLSYTPTQALVNSDVFAVVNRVSSDVASCDIKVDGYQGVIDRPFGNVMTRYSFIQSIVIQMMIRGNAYALIHRDGSKITGFELVPDDQVQVQVNDEGDDLTYILNFPDSDRQEHMVVGSDDMLHFKLIQTGEASTQYMGVSPLESLVTELNLQDKSAQLSLASVIHSLAPTYTLTIPKGNLNATAKENIRSQFEKQTSGGNAGRAIVLDQSTELGTIQQSNDIDGLLKNQEYIQLQIAKAFCIPPEYLNGQGDQQSSADQIKALYESTLSIYISPIVEELKNKLHTDISVDISNIIDPDHSSLISNIGNLVKNGVISASAGQQLLAGHGAFPELATMTDTVPQPAQKGGVNEDEGESDNQ